MSRIQQTIATLVLTLLAASTASAQHHHVPHICGRYHTNGTEICTITQNGTTVHLSSLEPGVARFDFSGTHGQRQFASKNRRVQVVHVGFQGKYRVTYFDGRSPVEGYASLFRTQKQGFWEVRFFNFENGQLVESESKWITRAGPLTTNQTATRPTLPVQTARPNNVETDDFNLLSENDLDNLGI